jgi:hypothetical protein
MMQLETTASLFEQKTPPPSNPSFSIRVPSDNVNPVRREPETMYTTRIPVSPLMVVL